jgi:hypothetical protein
MPGRRTKVHLWGRANTEAIRFEGESRRLYLYSAHDLDVQLKDRPGNFIYARETEDGFEPLFVGEASSLSLHSVAKDKEGPLLKEATHILAHLSSPAAEERRPLPPRCDREAVSRIVAGAMLKHWRQRGWV